MYKPTPRERPVGEKPYGPRPRERPVDDPMLKGRPVDVLAYEPTPRERPVDDQAYEPMPEGRPFTEPTLRGRPVDDPAYEPTPRERPVDNPTLRERPVEDQACEPMPEGRPFTEPTLRGRPVDDPAYEPTPRERPVDNPTLRERPVDDQKSGPMTSGGPADGPKTEPRPKERPVDPKTVPLMYKPPPPSDLPEWSDSEVMPLIIIENNSGVANPRTTDGLSPVGPVILLPQSPEMTSLEDQGALSAPLSPNRVRKVHSQDMPAEGSIFDVSPDVPGFNMRPALAVELHRFQQPVLWHQLHLLSVQVPRGWIQRRLCQSIIYQRTVALVLISRLYRPCSPREFHRTVSLGRPRRISYGISSGKDLLMWVQPQWKRRTVP